MCERERERERDRKIKIRKKFTSLSPMSVTP